MLDICLVHTLRLILVEILIFQILILCRSLEAVKKNWKKFLNIYNRMTTLSQTMYCSYLIVKHI